MLSAPEILQFASAKESPEDFQQKSQSSYTLFIRLEAGSLEAVFFFFFFFGRGLYLWHTEVHRLGGELEL